MSNNRIILLIVSTALLFAGCARGISGDSLRQVDEEVAFSRLHEAPQQFVGKTVLLGGRIIELENYGHQTEFTVLQHDLGLGKRPKPASPGTGRFLVTTNHFLDPEIYSPGRWVTVLGLVTGEEIRPVQERFIAYPVLAAMEIHLWSVRETAQPRTGLYFGLGFGFGL